MNGPLIQSTINFQFWIARKNWLHIFKSMFPYRPEKRKCSRHFQFNLQMICLKHTVPMSEFQCHLLMDMFAVIYLQKYEALVMCKSVVSCAKRSKCICPGVYILLFWSQPTWISMLLSLDIRKYWLKNNKCLKCPKQADMQIHLRNWNIEFSQFSKSVIFGMIWKIIPKAWQSIILRF